MNMQMLIGTLDRWTVLSPFAIWGVDTSFGLSYLVIKQVTSGMTAEQQIRVSNQFSIKLVPQ